MDGAVSAKVKLHRSHGVFLDPESAGSTIQWAVDVTGRPPNPDAKQSYLQDGRVTVSISANLSDCSRTISWDFSDGDSSIDKIDAAILAFTRLRSALVWAQAKAAALRSKYGIDQQEDDE